ncbi:MAG: hypothetical protein JST28_05520 [Acidobacteria bacterium]|nr:hypothetical protein [Acidobacteriota bacterium]
MWFAITAIVVIIFVSLVSKKYGTLLNPVAFYAGFFLMSASVVPLLYSELNLFGSVSSKAINFTCALDILYFSSVGLPFLISPSPFLSLFAWGLRFARPVQLHRSVSRNAEMVLLTEFLLLYVALMIASRVGLLWITSSREAYQFHRASVGILWGLCQATLILAFLCRLNRCARTAGSAFFSLVPFACVALFLGSKAFVLSYFVLALFHVHTCIKPVSNKFVVLCGSCVLFLGLAIQILQGTAAELINTLIYFDYFSNSAAFIDRFHEFGFHYGTLTLSTLWFYVPRALYAAKPFSFGSMAATELLYPGAAESEGATPGLMQWIVGYADWGIAGVIIYGLLAGFLAKGAYELFRKNKDVQSMAIFAQVGLIYYIEMFPNAPFLIFALWLLSQAMLIQSVTSSGHKTCPTSKAAQQTPAF